MKEVEKQKQKRCEVAEKKTVEKKENLKITKQKKPEMWKRLRELNKEFSEIKKAQKDSKKCLKV